MALLRSSDDSCSRKPASSFDEHHHDDDIATRGSNARWWDWSLYTGQRPRTTISRWEQDGLLADDFPVKKPKWSIRNYCVFGGISGMSVLAMLLAINLLLVIANRTYMDPDYDAALSKWGQPGTGTEGLSWYPTSITRDVIPIPCHSHNDYWRKVPLFSALRAGCTGVEADVWLFDNELYIGHNTASLTRNRTFTSLYIDPLVELLDQMNPQTDFYHGRSHGAFDEDPEKTLTLLIDVKTGGAETWPWVLEQLQPLRERGWLSFVENGKVHMRPIIVVGTGNTPFDILTANSTYRDAFFDAPLETMWEEEDADDDPLRSGEQVFEDGRDENPSSQFSRKGQGQVGTLPETTFDFTNSYYASVAFGPAIGRVWRRRLSPRQMSIIRGQIRGAHQRGLKVRYWDLPSWPIGLRNHIWDVLVEEGVDMLNVDDLKSASKRDWRRGRH